MSREIRKETDFLGNEKEVIYENGSKVGYIKEEQTLCGLGQTVKREYDNAGNKVSETRREHTLLGLGPTVDRTYSPDGERLSETRKEETFFGLGPRVERSYDEKGNIIAEARYKKTFFGLGPTVKRIEYVEQGQSTNPNKGSGYTQSEPVAKVFSGSATPNHYVRKHSGVQWFWMLVIVVLVVAVLLKLESQPKRPVTQLPSLPFMDFSDQVDLVIGAWTLRQMHHLYGSIENDAKSIARLPQGTPVEAKRIGIRTLNYQVYVLKKSITYDLWNGIRQGRQEVNVLLKKGDRVAVLSYYGEGECRVWVKGAAYIAACPDNYEGDSFDVDSRYGETKTEIWAEIVTKAGVVGYLRNPDAQGMSKYD